MNGHFQDVHCGTIVVRIGILKHLVAVTQPFCKHAESVASHRQLPMGNLHMRGSIFGIVYSKDVSRHI